MDCKFELGSQVKVKTTGQKGTVVGNAVYLYGSPAVYVQPENAPDGTVQRRVWRDADGMDAVEE